MVKRLYGRTNKRNATTQIGQHVRQLERAQLAAEHETMNERSKTQTARVDDDIDQDLDKHHQISKSRKDAVDIYSYIYANRGDPAFDVRLRIPCTYSGMRV